MSALRNRNFAILYFGLLMSVIGNHFFMIALPWYVFSTTGDKLNLALTGVFLTLPGIIGIFSGVFVDRWRKRKTMILTNIIRGILSFSLYIIVFFDPPIIFLLIPVVLLVSVGTVYKPAESAILPLILNEDELTSAMGFIKSGAALAQLTGMLVGGLLINLVDIQLLFLFDALTFVISLVSLLFVRVDESVPSVSEKLSFKRDWVHDWLEGLYTIIQSKNILQVILVTAITGGLLAPLEIIMTAWVKGDLGGSAFVLGMVNASLLAGTLVGGALLGIINKWVHLKKVITMGLIMAGISISMVGVYVNIYWTITLMLITGFSMGIFNGSISAMIFRISPNDILGRIFSVADSLSYLAAPLGMALYGWMMVYTSLQWIYALIGIPVCLIGLSFLTGKSENESNVSPVQKD